MSEQKCQRCELPEQHCCCEYAMCVDCNGDGAHCGCMDDMEKGCCDGGGWCPNALYCTPCDGTGSVFVRVA